MKQPNPILNTLGNSSQEYNYYNNINLGPVGPSSQMEMPQNNVRYYFKDGRTNFAVVTGVDKKGNPLYTTTDFAGLENTVNAIEDENLRFAALGNLSGIPMSFKNGKAVFNIDPATKRLLQQESYYDKTDIGTNDYLYGFMNPMENKELEKLPINKPKVIKLKGPSKSNPTPEGRNIESCGPDGCDWNKFAYGGNIKKQLMFGGLTDPTKSNYNIQRANELGYQRDENGHLPSVDNTNGMWLKSKDHPTAWMEYLYGHALNPNSALKENVVVNPEGHFGENQLQYINKSMKNKYMFGGPSKDFDPNTSFNNTQELTNWLSLYGSNVSSAPEQYMMTRPDIVKLPDPVILSDRNFKPNTENKEAFLNDAYLAARAVSNNKGLFPEVIAAMAANESRYGKSGLNKKQNNYFGIRQFKGTPQQYKSDANWATDEYNKEGVKYTDPSAKFEKHPSFVGSMEALIDFLSRNPRYEQVFKASNPYEQLELLKQAGYRTGGWKNEEKILKKHFKMQKPLIQPSQEKLMFGGLAAGAASALGANETITNIAGLAGSGLGMLINPMSGLQGAKYANNLISEGMGNSKTSFAMGGDIQKFTGPSHEQGGVTLTPQVEVEGGEIMTPNKIVLSDRLGPKGKKGPTYAQLGDKIRKRLEGRKGDKLTEESVNREIAALEQLQESDPNILKAREKQQPSQFALGGNPGLAGYPLISSIASKSMLNMLLEAPVYSDSNINFEEPAGYTANEVIESLEGHARAERGDFSAGRNVPRTKVKDYTFTHSTNSNNQELADYQGNFPYTDAETGNVMNAPQDFFNQPAQQKTITEQSFAPTSVKPNPWGYVAQAAGPLAQLGYAALTPAQNTQFDRMNPALINLDPARAAIERQGALSNANTRRMNAGARTIGANMAANTASNVGIARGVQDGMLQSYLQENTYNTNARNQANQFNAQVQMQERIANEQNQAARRNMIFNSIGNLGTGLAAGVSENTAMKAQDLMNQRALNMANSMFGNYTIDANGNITFRS